MRMPSGRVRKLLLAGVAGLLLAGVAAPFVQAEGFKNAIREALERSLHRRVQIGTAHFNLFTGPGFSVTDVLIHEDPAFGIEPFAHLETLEARVKLSSLWTGRLDFSSLRLMDGSVNLVKKSNGGWNAMPLLGRAHGIAPGGSLPALHILNGRLNFKFDDTKSSFYVTSADVDIAPRSGQPGSFDVRFVGSPARSDRTAQGFGALSGRGRWTGSGQTEPSLDLQVDLERSALDEMIRLLRGHPVGVQGFITSRARISGGLSNLKVNGSMEVDEFHRWDLVPLRSSGWRLQFGGSIDVHAQRVDLHASTKDETRLPLALRVKLFDYLSKPRWAADLTLNRLQASQAVEVLRHLGAPVPPSWSVEGALTGVAGFSSASGMQGTIVLDEPRLVSNQQVEVSAKRADLSFQDGQVHLSPTRISLAPDLQAEVRGRLDLASRQFTVAVAAAGLKVATLQTSTRQLIGAARIPALSLLRRGTVSGALQYAGGPDADAGWSGAFDLRDAQLQVAGLSEPVAIAAASVNVDGERLAVSRMRSSAGDVAFTGDYRYEPGAANPHRFRLEAKELDLGELERLLTPSLKRQQGFFARTLRFRGIEIPAWLKGRLAEGTVRIGSVRAGDVEFTAVRTAVSWQGTQVRLSPLEANWEDAAILGGVNIALDRREPVYELRGKVNGMPWQTGKVDLLGSLQSSGMGSRFLMNLLSKGTFEARSIAMAPDMHLRSASGSYALSMSEAGPRVKLTSLLAALETERFTGQGATQPDGRVQIEMASTSRLMRINAGLSPLQLDVSLARPGVPR